MVLMVHAMNSWGIGTNIKRWLVELMSKS